MPNLTTRFSLPLLALAHLPVAAETALPPLVVTATRTPQTVAESATPTLVIDRAAIERSSARDLGQLLRQHAGLELGRNGGSGQATSVFTRGTESNHTLVLLNGVKLNPATIGGAALHNLALDMVERVEVVFGPRSGLYGSEAIGGVVQIFTRGENPPGLSGHARAEAGSDAASALNAGLRYAGGPWQADLAVEQFDSDGFPTRVESDHPSGHRRRSVNAGVSWEGEVARLEAGYFETHGNTEYLDYFLSPLSQDFTDSAAHLKLSLDWSDSWRGSLMLSRFHDRIEQVESSDYARTRRDQVEWQTDFNPNPVHQLSAGLSLSREHAASQVYGSGYAQAVDSQDLFLQDQLDLGPHQVLAVLRYSRHEAFGGHLTGGVDYAWQFQPGWRLFAAAGSAFRAPDATDRFGYGGNPDLQPETSRHLELGLRRQWRESHSLSLSLFHTRLRHLIVFNDPDDYLGPLPGQNQNLERARVDGAELRYAWARGDWRLDLHALLQDPRNADRDSVLPRRARHHFDAGLFYAPGPYQLGLEFNAAGSRKDSDFSNARMAGYGLLNLSAEWRLAPHWRVQAGVENLLARDYQLAAGFNTGGRLWRAGVRVDF